MARVTEPEVEKILHNPDEVDVEPFITAANLVVTQNLSGTILSTAELKEIERWLAAHLAGMRIRQEDSIKVGDASAKFTGTYGLGLDNTQYGQQVKVLDRTGILASLAQPRAKFSTVSRGELP